MDINGTFAIGAQPFLFHLMNFLFPNPKEITCPDASPLTNLLLTSRLIYEATPKYTTTCCSLHIHRTNPATQGKDTGAHTEETSSSTTRASALVVIAPARTRRPAPGVAATGCG
uniref:Uncharacterized protein n=1 Tax=Arundo donax TaxID=35708 RepID=A0A0A9B241_ARUDO